MKLLITDLAGILNTHVVGSHDAIRNTQYASRVSTDSRMVKPGDCFFAISGENFDGHDFLADVFAKGASCAVVSKDISMDSIRNKIILKVPDTVKALGDLAAWYRKDCNFKVVAITGSVGKTTTRQIVYHVVSQKFKTHQPAKNFNNFIGLPLSILAAPVDSRLLILELATNHTGEIEYLSKIASPDIALITNVYPAHLEGFGSIEKIAEEKLSIFKGLCPTGTLIINADCQPLFDCARRANLTFRTFSCPERAKRVEGSCSTPADYLARDISVGPLTSSFTIDNVTVELPLPGKGNVENAVAAWSICSSLGVSIRDFAEAVKTITPVSMRSELLQIGPLTVISDCYNANPASMKNALDILSSLANSLKRRSVFICGDMAELGDSAQILHRQLGEQIVSSGVNLLITVGRLTAETARNVSSKIQVRHFPDTAQLCDTLRTLINDFDVILVKGSRVNKLEAVIEKLKQFKNT